MKQETKKIKVKKTKQYILRIEPCSDEYDVETITNVIDNLKEPQGRVSYVQEDVIGSQMDDWMILIDETDNITIKDVIKVFSEKFNVERDCIHIYTLK
jgi:hypothetical protein